MNLGRNTLILGSVAILGAAGCSSSTQKKISATVARNEVAVGAKKEFSDHHYSLNGLPTCTTTPVGSSNTRVNIACRGKTDKGEQAILLGKTQGANEVRGTFAGLVNGVKVFTTTCIGC